MSVWLNREAVIFAKVKIGTEYYRVAQMRSESIAIDPSGSKLSILPILPGLA